MVELDKIPPKRRRVVQYFLDYPEQLVIKGSVTLAKDLNVDRSTLISACRDLGYKGIKEYKKAIKNRLTSFNNQSFTHKKLLGEIKSTDSLDDSIISSLSSDLTAIEETIKNLDFQLIKKIVELLDASDSVFIVGLGYNKFLADYFHILLRTVRRNITPVTNYHGEIYDAINNLTKNDVVIGFAFNKVMRDTQRIFNKAKNIKAKTISITDSEHSILNHGSDLQININNPSLYFFSPNVAVLAIFNAIMHCYVEKNKPHSINTLNEYYILSNENDVYIN